MIDPDKQQNLSPSNQHDESLHTPSIDSKDALSYLQSARNEGKLSSSEEGKLHKIESKLYQLSHELVGTLKEALGISPETRLEDVPFEKAFHNLNKFKLAQVMSLLGVNDDKVIEQITKLNRTIWQSSLNYICDYFREIRRGSACVSEMLKLSSAFEHDGNLPNSIRKQFSVIALEIRATIASAQELVGSFFRRRWRECTFDFSGNNRGSASNIYDGPEDTSQKYVPRYLGAYDEDEDCTLQDAIEEFIHDMAEEEINENIEQLEMELEEEYEQLAKSTDPEFTIIRSRIGHNENEIEKQKEVLEDHQAAQFALAV